MTTSLSLEPNIDDLRVIDTEGTPTLREVAVLDGRGQLLYEARTPDDDNPYYAADLVRPLPELLRDLRQLLQDHPVIAHNASHDSGVLAASFECCGLAPPSLSWQCTQELAQRIHPGCPSYALGPLCDQLAVGPEPFRPDAAHQASYDARFTYLLYRRLQRDQHSRRLADAPNPFGSARVDTPFQTFADDRKVHQAAFARLSAVLHSVTSDVNQQSQSAVLVGEPGSGKTHLVMRLANEVLRNNRLLFVRQPTQASTVLFHIYSRTLESLVERVGDGGNNQLDLLLIRALRPIMREVGISTSHDEVIMAALEAEDLSRLGQPGSEARRQRWERLEIRLLRWLADRYSSTGYGRQILQGLLRFCRYKDAKRRESLRRWLATGEHEPVANELDGLSPWNEDLLREEFSLQALRILGLISSLDAPLILVFDQLEGLWLEGNEEVLKRFGEVAKELLTHMPHTLMLMALFPNRWQQFQNDLDGSVTDRIGQYVIQLESPRSEEIEEIIDLRLQPLEVRAMELFSSDELDQILHLSSLRRSLNRAAAVFDHRVHGVPLTPLPPPPPPPLNGLGDSSLQLNQRLLNLEQECIRLQERVARLAESCSGLAQNSTPTNPAAPQDTEREGAPPVQSPETVEGWSESADEPWHGNPYEDLFRRYRETTIETIRQRWEKTPIIDDSHDAGKLRQICLGYKKVRPIDVENLRLGSLKVPDNVLILNREKRHCIAFLHLVNGNAIQSRLRNLNQLVLRHRQVQFILMRDVSVPAITSKAASAAFKAFLTGSGDGSQRTHERPLTLERRIALEFVHQLVNDIANRELDVPMADGLALLARYDPENWVVQLLHPKRRP